MKNINIAITLFIKPEENIWKNGIAQNVINFYQILNNSPNDYNVIIVNTNDNHKNIEYNLEGINMVGINDVINDIDLIFILGSQIKDEHYELLKKNKTKIVHYSCGSSYILDMESVLFGDSDTDKSVYKHTPDEIWSIPQNYEPNKYYFETIYRREVKSVPFVWSPVFIDYILDNYKIRGFYKPGDKPKNISSFEPNINIVKYAMYNILIVEKAYREKPHLINHFYVTNALKIMKNSLFVNTMSKLDIVKDNIISFESRYRMPYFLDEYTDVVVSHQMLNPLNYAYLDALYLKYPLVHNASMIKDGGYYYPNFNAEIGKKQMLFALSEHDKNLEEYDEKSKKVIDRYLPTNEESISIYDKIIKKLFKN